MQCCILRIICLLKYILYTSMICIFSSLILHIHIFSCGVYVTQVDLTRFIETQSFIFDDAFEADESNELIYGRTIGHLVPFVFEGGKASCFAYGQTGSGVYMYMYGICIYIVYFCVRFILLCVKAYTCILIK